MLNFELSLQVSFRITPPLERWHIQPHSFYSPLIPLWLCPLLLVRFYSLVDPTYHETYLVVALSTSPNVEI